MPLHADVERMRWILDPFDDAVGSERGDTQPFADVTDRLVMRGIHVQLLFTEDLGEQGAIFDEDVVTMAVARLAGVLDIAAHLGVDVLDQSAAGGNIHHLHAETNAESRDAAFAGDASEREVVVLPARIHRLDARVPLLAVDARIAILA